MALTPCPVQSSILAAHSEAAELQARCLAQAYREDYAAARGEYHAAHERYGTRTDRPPAARVITADAVRENISYYTSCPLPNMKASYAPDSQEPCTRDINRELKDRAGDRQKADILCARGKQASALVSGTGSKASAKEDPPVVMVARAAELEHNDILEIEARQFRQLAKTYYDALFGRADAARCDERDARRLMEDMELGVALGTLAAMRQRINRSEQQLIIRAMGLYPARQLRNGRARALAIQEAKTRAAEASLVLDSMRAVPLWQRVTAIRAETEAEEEVTMRTVLLAHVTEADLIRRGFGRHNAFKGGVFEIDTNAAIPENLDDSVAYAHAAEQLFCELREETARMAVVDGAMAEFDVLWTAMSELPEGTVVAAIMPAQ